MRIGKFPCLLDHRQRRLWWRAVVDCEKLSWKYVQNSESACSKNVCSENRGSPPCSWQKQEDATWERAPAGPDTRRSIKTVMVERFRQRDVGGNRHRSKNIFVARVPWQRGSVENDRGSTMRKFVYGFENVDTKSGASAEKDCGFSSCGQLFNSLKWRERRHNDMAEVPRKCGCVVERQPWNHDCREAPHRDGG